MKIGVSAFAWTTAVREPHFKLFPKLREHGLTAFEIPMFAPTDIAALPLRQALEANQLECTICAILPPGINPISPDRAVRERSFEHFVQCIEKAAGLGAKLLGGPVYAPIGYLPAHRPTEEEKRWAVDSLQRIIPMLEAHAMPLALEPVNRSETHFLRTALEAKALCDAVDHPLIGATIDTFHANIEEKSIAAAIRTLGRRLKHMHMSENDRSLLGSGHVDFSGIIDTLREIGYEGYLTIEGFGYDAAESNAPGFLQAEAHVSPEELALSGAAYLQGLMR